MIRRDFQSIKKQISANLSPTDWRHLYPSLRAKSVKFIKGENYFKKSTLSNGQMHRSLSKFSITYFQRSFIKLGAIKSTSKRPSG